MKTTTRIMLDLETMGTAPGSAIFAIGAVKFIPEENIISGYFYKKITLQSCAAHGLRIDPETAAWWGKQSEAARKELIDAEINGCELPAVLIEFSHWCNFSGVDETGGRAKLCRTDAAMGSTPAPINPQPSTIAELWGNGAGFDNVLLSVAYATCLLPRPWNYKADRCYRTVRELNKHIPFTPPEIPHHGYHDARAQALHLMRILKVAGAFTEWLDNAEIAAEACGKTETHETLCAVHKAFNG